YLWVGANNFSTTPKKGWVLQYDPDDLTLVEVHELDAHWAEGGAWHDVGDGPEYWAVYTDWDHVSRHKIVGGVMTKVDDYLLPLVEGESSTNLLYQGGAWLGDLFITPRKPTDAGRLFSEIHIHTWTGSGFVAVHKQKQIAAEADEELQ